MSNGGSQLTTVLELGDKVDLTAVLVEHNWMGPQSRNSNPPTHLDGDQGGGTDVELVDEVLVEVAEVGVQHSEAGDVARGRAAGGWEWGNGGSCWFWFESLFGNSCAGHLGGECWTITAWSRKHLQQQNVSNELSSRRGLFQKSNASVVRAKVLPAQQQRVTN